MPIQYHPGLRAVLLCDFSRGFLPPEMVKRRPAIVIVPQMGSRAKLCTVVPISTDPPHKPNNYNVELPGLKLPEPYDKGPNWVKADLIFSASFARLDLFRSDRGEGGKRIYEAVFISPDDFRLVQRAILCGLGMTSLTKHVDSPS
jgi:mRNA interferase MazF